VRGGAAVYGLRENGRTRMESRKGGGRRSFEKDGFRVRVFFFVFF
jgi:hypothetical protein